MPICSNLKYVGQLDFNVTVGVVFSFVSVVSFPCQSGGFVKFYKYGNFQ